MKTILLSIFLLAALIASAQENAITISGGYAFANLDKTVLQIEGQRISTSGWRINGLWEYNSQGKTAHGLSIGYIRTTGEGSEDPHYATSTYDVSSLPIYYAPKFLFGKSNLKGFAKGCMGMQYSWYSHTGAIGGWTDHGVGFLVGAGAGLQYSIHTKLFLSAEYEVLFMTNTSYRNMNTAGVGIGFRFKTSETAS